MFIKIKIHSSCEIEDFVETHLFKLCVILRWRVLRVVCPHQECIGRRLPLELQCSLYQGQQGDVSQSVRGNYNPPPSSSTPPSPHWLYDLPDIRDKLMHFFHNRQICPLQGILAPRTD